MPPRHASPGSLQAYRHKRNFGATPEPSGEDVSVEGRNIFVVQKHAASHLHYDFRLRLHGVLKSWAIPKGPSLDPSQRRLAQQTEDHPLEYATFEGVIPAGEYGAGAVMVWDTGEWEPLEEGKQGYYRGRLHFVLHGHKLQGSWTLLRENKDSTAWYLVKEDDAFARSADEDSILDDDKSAVTGRTMNQIASDRDAVWTREGAIAGAQDISFGHETGGELPDYIVPQVATLVASVPETDEWLHEIKYDGYRIVCRIDKHKDGIRLFTRKGNDFTSRLKTLTQAVDKLPVTQAWLDGEIVVLTSEGRTDFNALQNAFTDGDDSAITYLVFDVMNYEGYDLRNAPLSERKGLLEELIPEMEKVRYVDHVVGRGQAFYREACKRQLEGVVSKRADSLYLPERNSKWLKIKCSRRQEFVVGGYTESGAGRPFGSLLAGFYDKEGRLIFAGKIKTGYGNEMSNSLIHILRRFEQRQPAFHNPPAGREYRNPHWLKPELVAEVEYGEITEATGLLRHASFKGLRQDKDAREVTLEIPEPVPQTKQPREE